MHQRPEEFETGIVTGVQGEEALVQLNLQEACETCGARVLCVPDSAGKRVLRAANPLHAKVGMRVAVSEQSGFLLKLSMLQYGIPFIGFIAGIFLLYFMPVTVASLPPELILFGGGLAGLFLGALISRQLADKIAGSGSSFFEIARIL
jgi:positive regulator of sigma E activity